MLQQIRIGGRDYFVAPWCYLIWGTPIVVEGIASAAYQQEIISETLMGTILVLAVGWIGISCFINGRSCGRVHCMIDGYAFPSLSFLGALNVLGIISFPWNYYSPTFLAILLASFIGEMTMGRYYRGESKSFSC